MTRDATFLMGKFEARLPADREYVESHFWLKPTPEPSVYQVGFTAYAVRLLQDVYFLDWSIDSGTVVGKKQEIGQIESAKAVSTMYAPLAGTILRFNDSLMNDPSLINVDCYGRGWLYELRTDQPTLPLDDYLAHLHANWEKTQQLLKNQYNG